MEFLDVEETLLILENLEKFNDNLKKRVKQLFSAEVCLENPQVQTDECYFRTINIKGRNEVNVRKAKNYLMAVFDTTSSICEIFEYEQRYAEVIINNFDRVEQISSAHLVKDNNCVLIFGVNQNILSLAESLFTKIVEDSKNIGHVENSNYIINLIEDSDSNTINNSIVLLNDSSHRDDMYDNNKMDISFSDDDSFDFIEIMDVDTKTPEVNSGNEKLIANIKPPENSNEVIVLDESLSEGKKKKKRKNRKKNKPESEFDTQNNLSIPELNNVGGHIKTLSPEEVGKINNSSILIFNQSTTNQLTNAYYTNSTTNNIFISKPCLPLKTYCRTPKSNSSQVHLDSHDTNGGEQPSDPFSYRHNDIAFKNKFCLDGTCSENEPGCSSKKYVVPHRFLPNNHFRNNSKIRCQNQDISVDSTNNSSIQSKNYRNLNNHYIEETIGGKKIIPATVFISDDDDDDDDDDDTSSADYLCIKNGVNKMLYTDNKVNDNKVCRDGTLRPIVIDGSNIAMHHGLNKVFSCKGIELVVNYFSERGHKQVIAFVPQWRRATSISGNNIQDLHILDKLYEKGQLVFTPSRRVKNTIINSYDDRFILRYAAEEEAIVISNDQFKDLYHEPIFKETIEKRVLQVTFVGDKVMFPDDPLGRHGPTLDVFLKFSDPCSGMLFQVKNHSNLNDKLRQRNADRQNWNHRSGSQNISQPYSASHNGVSQLQQPRFPPLNNNIDTSYSAPNNLSTRFPFLNHSSTSNNPSNSRRPNPVTGAFRKKLLHSYKGKEKQIDYLLQQYPTISEYSFFAEEMNNRSDILT